VTAVIWRVRRGNGFLDTRIPVRDNVYIGRFPGRHGHGLYVYFVDASGKHLVIGPAHRTPEQRAELRRSAQLDRTAGRTPTVDPQVAGVRTLFTLRMRVNDLSRRYVYAVTLTGRQPGHCAQPYRYRIGLLPGSRGSERGFIRALFGPGPGYQGWCKGVYGGIVRRQPGTSWRARGPVVGRFKFEVR
jgi:hypothetical protein